MAENKRDTWGKERMRDGREKEKDGSEGKEKERNGQKKKKKEY